MALIGYFGIGWLLSSGVCGLALWLTGTLPERGTYSVHWQGQVGWALGYGFVASGIAVPVWLGASLVPRLRGVRAWWAALVAANALVIVALITAAART